MLGISNQQLNLDQAMTPLHFLNSNIKRNSLLLLQELSHRSLPVNGFACRFTSDD